MQDYEQRLKREEMAQNEFRQDLRATAERERAEAENRLQTISTKNESLLHENEKLKAMLNNKNQTPNASQQDQLTRFDTDSAEESVSRKQQQFDNKSVQKKKSITIANDSLALAGGRKHPPPLNFEMTMLSNQPHPMNTSSTTDLDVPSNSESSEVCLFFLASVDCIEDVPGEGTTVRVRVELCSNTSTRVYWARGFGAFQPLLKGLGNGLATAKRHDIW